MGFRTVRYFSRGLIRGGGKKIWKRRLNIRRINLLIKIFLLEISSLLLTGKSIDQDINMSGLKIELRKNKIKKILDEN